MTRKGWLGVLTACALALAPVVAAIAIAAVMVTAGNQQQVRVQVAVPGILVAVGLLCSIAIAVVLIVRWLRAAAEARTSRLRAAAEADAVARERAQHHRFLARLDHELKNPLTAIRAATAAADTSSPEWRTVDAQASRLSALVRDLRKISELETCTLEREQVDVEQLLAEAIEAGPVERTALSVTRIPWPVPVVSADRDLFAIAIDNVLGNAAKYSDGPIEVRLREQDGWVVIDVADSGRGIPSDEVPQVFDELARAANARDVPGSGLGLAVVAVVVRRHGGEVSLRSLENAGTVVTLRLPAAS